MLIELLIEGRHVTASEDRRFKRYDPVTGDLASDAAAASVEDALKAVAAAQAAFPAWAEMAPTTRRALLNKAADVMSGKTDEFVQAGYAEIGATAPWIKFNLILSVNMIREAASLVTQIAGEIIPSDKPGTLAMAVARPKGVCLGIAPWNAPIILGTRAVVTALACGNTVVLKSSELCPRLHRLIGDCFVEAGFPAGVINVISNAPEDAAVIVEALIKSPEVRHINFTGSTRVGRIIGRLAGENLKPALLELGGKAPFVVLDDADIDAAVNAAIFGCFANQGQICMSTERLIVDDKVADEFSSKLAERASRLPAGNPRDHVVLGGLAMPGAVEKMDALVADAVAKGAIILAGGKGSGAIYEATLVGGVTAEMKLYSEESFGPVKPIIRVHGEEEAIRVANDSEYGLSSAIFGRDVTRALKVANRIEAGICHINGPTVSDEPQMPFGGMKNSGFGRFGGKAGIAEFTDLRWITIEDPNQHYPF